MKTIITLTDQPNGSVNLEYMTQMTTEEAASGLQPWQSSSYQMAAQFQTMVTHAKEAAHELRMRHAEAIEKAEYGPCLH